MVFFHSILFAHLMMSLLKTPDLQIQATSEKSFPNNLDQDIPNPSFHRSRIIPFAFRAAVIAAISAAPTLRHKC
jgi:hypothetical protein